LQAVVAVGLAASDAADESLLYAPAALGGLYGAVAILVVWRTREDEQRPAGSTRARLVVAVVYLASVALTLPAGADRDATVMLAVAPLFHLLGTGLGLCAAALAALGIAALRAAFSVSDDGGRGSAWAVRAFAGSLGIVVLALVPVAGVDALAYSSPYEGHRAPDWRLLLLGDERLGVVVHHAEMLVVARVLAWMMLAGLAVLVGLLVLAVVRSRGARQQG
jgi:hypothetical protein